MIKENQTTQKKLDDGDCSAALLSRWESLTEKSQKCLILRLNAHPVLLNKCFIKRFICLPHVMYKQTRLSWLFRPQRANVVIQLWFTARWGLTWTRIFLLL